MTAIAQAYSFPLIYDHQASIVRHADGSGRPALYVDVLVDSDGVAIYGVDGYYVGTGYPCPSEGIHVTDCEHGVFYARMVMATFHHDCGGPMAYSDAVDCLYLTIMYGMPAPWETGELESTIAFTVL